MLGPIIPQWHQEFQPDQDGCWSVPAKWLLSQVSLCLSEGGDEILIAVKDGNLYIKGTPPIDEEMANIQKLIRGDTAEPGKSWAEEFPPWPP